MTAPYDLDALLADYREQGYVVLPGVLDPDICRDLRADCERLKAQINPEWHSPMPYWFGNMLERSPTLMWTALHRPPILDLAERILGPLVQLDNVTLAGFPSRDVADRGAVSGWHRDRWAHMPIGVYERPLAINAIAYLQDLTDDYGPLRVIPGSHREPVQFTNEQKTQPLPGEVLVHAKEGDVVLTHNGLVHSGTANVTGKPRYFFSIYLNTTWLRTTDTFDGPVCREIIAWARKRGDHRALRLLGQDDHLQSRANAGFNIPDADLWASWHAEDAATLALAAGKT